MAAHEREAPAAALLLTYEQAAGALQVSVETIRRLVKSGELGVVDFGHKNRRIERAELGGFIARRTVRPPAEAGDKEQDT